MISLRVSKKLEKKKNMYLIGILFDISKAYKDAYRIRGVANLWFKSYLSNGNECA